MSGYAAIGGVSATLATLLRDRMELPATLTPTDFQVTVGPPVSKPRLEVDDGTEAARVNVFLYRVTENPHLKNQEPPGVGNLGSYGRPPLAVDLHFLVTAFGTMADTQAPSEVLAHTLLGSAMRVLQDHPIVTESLMRRRGPAGERVLDDSLLGAYERVKITFDPLTLEDVTKLFTALNHPYRLSAAYRVSVVQIESDRPRAYPRLVGEPPAEGPRIELLPFRTPEVRELLVRRADDPPDVERPHPYASIGDTLVLLGSGFAGGGLHVAFGPLLVPVVPLSEGRIEVQVPDAALPDGRPIPASALLQPGPRAVTVAQRIAANAWFHSNQVVFLLAPRLVDVDAQTRPGELVVTGTRVHAPDLPGETLLGPHVVPKTSYRAASSSSYRIVLSEAFPARGVNAFVSGELDPFPPVASPRRELKVRLGAGSPITISLASRPTTLAEAAAELQGAIRNAGGGTHLHRLARVGVHGKRLLIIAGEPHAAVSFANADPDTTAQDLRLVASPGLAEHQPSTLRVHLSGALAPFPTLTAATPRLTAKLGATTYTLAFASKPATLAECATLLRDALAAAGAPSPSVSTLGPRLVVNLGGPDPVRFDVAPGDATTAGELLLRLKLPLRVRVNGAEALERREVDLP